MPKAAASCLAPMIAVTRIPSSGWTRNSLVSSVDCRPVPTTTTREVNRPRRRSALRNARCAARHRTMTANPIEPANTRLMTRTFVGALRSKTSANADNVTTTRKMRLTSIDLTDMTCVVHSPWKRTDQSPTIVSTAASARATAADGGPYSATSSRGTANPMNSAIASPMRSTSWSRFPPRTRRRRRHLTRGRFRSRSLKVIVS